jgi:hypothetical protein
LRFLLSFLLILTGALLTFPATLAVWERRDLMDRQQYIDTGNELLKKPGVQAALTERLTNDILAYNPFAPRELVRPVAAGIVAQLPDSDISQTVLTASYLSLYEWVRGDLSSEGDTIYLDFTPMIDQALANVGLNAARLRLPPETTRVILVQRQDLADAFRAARWFDKAAPFIALAPLVAFGLAFLVASDRGLALILTGAAVIGGAVLRIVALQGPLRDRSVEQALVSGSAEAAAREVYDAIVASFVRQDVMLIAVAAAVMAIGLFFSVTRRVV